jgi:hypothetical protein
VAIGDQPEDWPTERPGLSLTWVKNLDSEQVMSILGAGRRGPTKTLSEADNELLVGPAGAPGWLVAIEDSTWVGPDDAILTALSAEGEAINVLRTQTIETFAYAVGGVINVSFDTGMIENRHGADPDSPVLMAALRDVGLSVDGEDLGWQNRYDTGLVLRAIHQVFGVTVDRSLLTTPMASAVMPSIDPGPPPPPSRTNRDVNTIVTSRVEASQPPPPP